MFHGEPVEEQEEEQYLLFVSMTRARDRLILTRAAKDGEKELQRSSLLPGEGAEGETPWAVLPLPDQPGCPLPPAPIRLHVAPIVRYPLPASSLDTYDDCPRRYLYQYGYQLYDDLSPYLRMHQTISDSVRALLKAHQSGTVPGSEEELSDLIWQIFAAHEMTEVLYARDYFDEALSHVRRLWEDLQEGTVQPVDINQYVTLERPAGAVEIRVDQVVQEGDSPRWVRTRSGRERDDDHLDRRIMLYALAYDAEVGSPGNLSLHYTSTGTMRDASPRKEVLERHTQKIDQLLEQMAAGKWHPQPGQQCATCSFNLICPV
jgi:DNA helicase-2/ATP-dependent DNA helicase PcrA